MYSIDAFFLEELEVVEEEEAVGDRRNVLDIDLPPR